MTSRKTDTPAWIALRFASRKRNVHNLANHNWSQRRNSTTNCGDPQSHQSLAEGNLNRQELRSITAMLCMSMVSCRSAVLRVRSS